MKKITIITGVLCGICLILGIYGLYLNKTTEEDSKYTAKYIYMVDEEKEKNMPKEDSDYVFDKYECTGDVKGKWDKNEWKFIPRLTKNTTCTLYFKTKEFEVKFVTPEGITIKRDDTVSTTSTTSGITSSLIDPNTFSVKKDQNLDVNLEIKEGVEIEEVTCSDNQKASIKENVITLSKVSKDTVCTIKTKNASYTVEAKAVNGTLGEVIESIEYGKDASFTLTPKSGYVLDKIECTNEQKATFSGNKLIVSNVTNSTVCSVSFKTNIMNVTVSSPNGTITGEKTKTVSYNGTVTFSVSPKEGFAYSNVICTNSQTGTWASNSLTVSGVTSDTTCNINFNAVSTGE